MPLLLFGSAVIDSPLTDSPQLKVPHPAMAERRFVLEPLVEIAPEALHPILKKTARQLLDALPAGQVVRKVSF